LAPAFYREQNKKKKNIKSINAENILKLSTDCMLERINQYV